jgi:hypothetical protein
MPLTDADRARLAGVVRQMEANKETPETIQRAVGIFKQKYDTPATATDTPAPAGNPWPSFTSGFLSNALTSGINMAGNIASAVANPDATLAALGNTVEGLANEYVPGYVKAKEALGPTFGGYDPNVTKQQNAYADALKQNIYDRYGSFQKAGHTLYTDPVGVLADASTLADGVGLVADAAKLGKVAEVAKVASSATNPVNISMLAGKMGVEKLADKVAPRLYQSALKPSTTLSRSEVKGLVQTGLDKGIPVSEGGVTKLSGLIKNLNTKIEALINSDPNPQIDPNAVATRIDNVRPTFANQVNPESDVAALDAVKQEFLRNNPNTLTTAQAQKLKQNTYKQLDRKDFGELKGAQVEGQKQLARGLKEELENVFPELKDMNAKEGALIGLDGALEQAVKRIDNKDMLGLGGLISGEMLSQAGHGGIGAALGVAGALKLIMDHPVVKSRLGIALNRAAKIKGINLVPGSVSSRISSYVNALADAQARTANQDEEQQ